MKTLLGTVGVIIVIVVLAFAQQAPAKKLYVVTYVDVFPTYATEAAMLLQQFTANSRKDRGSVRFEVYRDVALTNHFSIVEVWEDQKAFEDHRALAHTRQFREKLQMGLGSPFDERRYYNLEP